MVQNECSLHTEINDPFSPCLTHTHTHKILVRNFLPHPSFVVANSSGADTAPSRANRTLAIAFSQNMIAPFLVTGRELIEES